MTLGIKATDIIEDINFHMLRWVIGHIKSQHI